MEILVEQVVVRRLWLWVGGDDSPDQESSSHSEPNVFIPFSAEVRTVGES